MNARVWEVGSRAGHGVSRTVLAFWWHPDHHDKEQAQGLRASRAHHTVAWAALVFTLSLSQNGCLSKGTSLETVSGSSGHMPVLASSAVHLEGRKGLAMAIPVRVGPANGVTIPTTDTAQPDSHRSSAPWLVSHWSLGDSGLGSLNCGPTVPPTQVHWGPLTLAHSWGPRKGTPKEPTLRR